MLFSDRFPNVHWAFMHFTAVPLRILKCSQLPFFGHVRFCCGFCRNVAGGGNCNMNHNGWHWMCSPRILWDYIYVQQYFRKHWVACLVFVSICWVKTKFHCKMPSCLQFWKYGETVTSKFEVGHICSTWRRLAISLYGQSRRTLWQQFSCVFTNQPYAPKSWIPVRTHFFQDLLCAALETSIWSLSTNHMWQNSYIA